jgi:hypothetical protein
MNIKKIAVAGALFGSLTMVGVAMAASHPAPKTSVQPTQVGAVQSQTPDTKETPDVAESKSAADTDNVQNNVQQGNQSGPDNQEAGDTPDGAVSAN